MPAGRHCCASAKVLRRRRFSCHRLMMRNNCVIRQRPQPASRACRVAFISPWNSDDIISQPNSRHATQRTKQLDRHRRPDLDHRQRQVFVSGEAKGRPRHLSGQGQFSLRCICTVRSLQSLERSREDEARNVETRLFLESPMNLTRCLASSDQCL